MVQVVVEDEKNRGGGRAGVREDSALKGERPNAEGSDPNLSKGRISFGRFRLLLRSRSRVEGVSRETSLSGRPRMRASMPTQAGGPPAGLQKGYSKLQESSLPQRVLLDVFGVQEPEPSGASGVSGAASGRVPEVPVVRSVRGGWRRCSGY